MTLAVGSPSPGAASSELCAVGEEPVGVLAVTDILYLVSGGAEMHTEFWWENLLPETIWKMGGKC